MHSAFDGLDVIGRTKGRVEVELEQDPTGENIFLAWGWPAAVLFLAEFLLWETGVGQPWCVWLPLGIPLVGVPLMIHFLRKDRERTHVRSKEARILLDYWFFCGAAAFVGGFVCGFAGIYEVCFLPLMGLLVGIGVFISGAVLRFRPMTVGGLVAAAMALFSLFFQGDCWHWQMLAISLVALSSLVIPGHLFRKSLKHGV